MFPFSQSLLCDNGAKARVDEQLIIFYSLPRKDRIKEQFCYKRRDLIKRSQITFKNTTSRMAPTKDMLEKLGWSNLNERRNKQKSLMMFKIVNGMTPVYLKDMLSKNIGMSCYNLRTSRDDIALPRARTDYYRNSFAFTGAKIWNSLRSIDRWMDGWNLLFIHEILSNLNIQV